MWKSEGMEGKEKEGERGRGKGEKEKEGVEKGGKREEGNYMYVMLDHSSSSGMCPQYVFLCPSLPPLSPPRCLHLHTYI